MATKITRKNPFAQLEDQNQQDAYSQPTNGNTYDGSQYDNGHNQQNDWGQPNQEYGGRNTNPFGKAPTYSEEPAYQDDIDMAREDGYNQASYGNQSWNPDQSKAQQFGQYNPGDASYQDKSGFGIEGGAGSYSPTDPLNEPPLLEGEYKILQSEKKILTLMFRPWHQPKADFQENFVDYQP